jgi:hypothetical protein
MCVCITRPKYIWKWRGNGNNDLTSTNISSKPNAWLVNPLVDSLVVETASTKYNGQLRSSSPVGKSASNSQVHWFSPHWWSKIHIFLLKIPKLQKNIRFYEFPVYIIYIYIIIYVSSTFIHYLAQNHKITTCLRSILLQASPRRVWVKSPGEASQSRPLSHWAIEPWDDRDHIFGWSKII